MKILFVCYANLCRSPLAEAVMLHLIREAGLAGQITVDSAGTHCPRPGEPPFFRTRDVLTLHGIESIGQARLLERADLDAFDYVLAMDRRNLSFILNNHAAGSRADVRLLLDFAQRAGQVDSSEVIDPYPDGDYAEAYRVIYAGCAALLNHIVQESGRRDTGARP